jgi:hypothetical protein
VHSGHSDGYHDDGGGHRQPVTVADLAAAASDAGLDFLAVSDHNTSSHWIDVDRVQERMPRLLLLHAREMTTYQGHFNAIGERRFTGFRVSRDQSMSRLMHDVGVDGAFLSINHPWLNDDESCGGCGWTDRSPLTIAEANGIEVINGSSPTPRGELPGWRFWMELLNRGAHLVAVGGSDVHDPASRSARVGHPATVVFARELSEDAIVTGLKSGRVFVRAVEHSQAAIDLAAVIGSRTVWMGGSVASGTIALSARVKESAGYELVWFRRGETIGSVRIQSDDETIELPVHAAAGDWFSAIVRSGGDVTLIANAIYVAD